jgi:hypothetical protein
MSALAAGDGPAGRRPRLAWRSPGDRSGARLHWAVRVALRTTFALLAAVVGVVLAAEGWIMARNPTIVADVGSDYHLYMDATARWLAGGAFYPANQLAGPYTDAIRPILYPPQALILFVPFTALPAILWFAIPIALTGWIVAWHRPNRWGWLAMGATIAVVPLLFLPYVAGTPTIWIIAFLALGTRWPGLAALVLLKPTLAPFALIGIKHRWWWAIAGLMAVAGLALWPLTLEWIQSVINLTGERSGLLYSAENLPLVAVLMIAWLTGRHAPTWRVSLDRAGAGARQGDFDQDVIGRSLVQCVHGAPAVTDLGDPREARTR